MKDIDINKKYICYFLFYLLIILSILYIDIDIKYLLTSIILPPVGYYLIICKNKYIFYFIILYTFIAQGILSYFFGINNSFWLTYFLIFFLSCKMIIMAKQEKIFKTSSIPLYIYTLTLYTFLFLISSIINDTDYLHFFGSVKNYVLIWVITIYIALDTSIHNKLYVLSRIIIFICIIQLPTTIIQKIYYINYSNNRYNWDAIVGTFGGDPAGGGQSGAMAIFLVLASFLVISLYKNGQITLKLTIFTLLCSFISIVLAEIKIVFVILPLLGMVYYRKYVFKNPFKFFFIAFIFFIILFIIYLFYQEYYIKAGYKYNSFIDMFNYEFDVNRFNKKTKEVSRIGALARWFDYNWKDWIHFLVGYGPSASRISATLGEGIVSRKLPFALSTSTASILLWDIGILGFSAFTLSFIFCNLSILRIIKSSYFSKIEVCWLELSLLSTFIFPLLLLYNQDAITNPTIQVYIACIYGITFSCYQRFPKLTKILFNK